MSFKTKQHVRSPRAGIRCSAVHSPDRYIRDLDRRLSASGGQTVNHFERKEFLMRQLQVIAHGEPSDVIELNAFSEPALGPEDVLISMEAAPLNPSDFLFV